MMKIKTEQELLETADSAIDRWMNNSSNGKFNREEIVFVQQMIRQDILHTQKHFSWAIEYIFKILFGWKCEWVFIEFKSLEEFRQYILSGYKDFALMHDCYLE